jgi:hypothetical protein
MFGIKLYDYIKTKKVKADDFASPMNKTFLTQPFIFSSAFVYLMI